MKPWKHVGQLRVFETPSRCSRLFFQSFVWNVCFKNSRVSYFWDCKAKSGLVVNSRKAETVVKM